jgi:dienelactone hydrolase
LFIVVLRFNFINITQTYRYIFAVLSLFMCVMACTQSALAQAEAKMVTYQDGKTTLEGYWSPSKCFNKSPMPVVLIVHQWRGLGDHEKNVADKVAELCYHAFAIDVYGQGVRPANDDLAKIESDIYRNDPKLALRRLNVAREFAGKQPGVDPQRMLAMGYCFGGGLVLDWARSGADLKGVVSFHGNLNARVPASSTPKASILVHNGADDPYVSPAEVTGFIDEMRALKADWMLTQYSGAVHAFTQVGAGNDPSKGFAYNEKADNRSWSSTTEFLMAALSRE